jgi:hypothetical protein
MPMLWEWIRGARAVGEEWEKSGPGSGVRTEGRSSAICRKIKES